MASPSAWLPQQQHHRKRAIQELVRGRELAYELQLAMKRSLADPSSLSDRQHQDLVSKIIGSFVDTLSILHYSSSSESDEFSQLPASHPPPPLIVDSHYSSDARKSEDSSDSCKPLTATSKDRRGCYKRRRTSETWTKESSSLIDDGHAWRKYGQKVILHAQYPRNYFRCTHKFDQGCQATKQVQMIQENPPIYRSTYQGIHTCKNLLKPPQIILDTTATERVSSVFLSFDQSIKPSNSNSNRLNNDSFMAVCSLTKQDTKGDVHEGLLNASSSCDYFLSPPDVSLTGPLSSAGSDHGDVMSSGVYSCTASTHDDSLGMDLVVGSVDDFDDFFAV